MSGADHDKWEAKYAGDWEPPHEPSQLLTDWADHLPRRGRALDVAGGAGRHALWLGARGFDVTLVDVSPTGLSMARAQAAVRGLELATVAADLDWEPLPEGPWDVVVMTFFLYRRIFEELPELLRPGGFFCAELPTRRNLERHAKPGARFLVEVGELRELAKGLCVVRYAEGWNRFERHTARLLAKRGTVP